MNWKAIVGFVIVFGGLTAVSFIVEKRSEGIGTAPFDPFILIVPVVFLCLGLYLFNKRRQKEAQN